MDEANLRQALDETGLGALAGHIIHNARRAYQTNPHGHHSRWRDLIKSLPDLPVPSHDFSQGVVQIGAPQDCDDLSRARIKEALLRLNPWRKGPFDLFGVRIDSEWRSDQKWARLVGDTTRGGIASLRGRRVLDVGCGNGYYLWRMLGCGATLALGIDPSQLFIAQFNAIKRYCPASPAFILPLKSEAFLPSEAAIPDEVGFDTVFSMGVLYHRRDPQTHLRELINFARPGGELVIETLVVDGDENSMLAPDGRYAKMRNVYAIPSVSMVAAWLEQAGLTAIRLIDRSQTSVKEQRRTEWMAFESLADFLDPTDSTKTVEGYPAPQRAIFICERS